MKPTYNIKLDIIGENEYLTYSRQVLSKNAVTCTLFSAYPCQHLLYKWQDKRKTYCKIMKN